MFCNSAHKTQIYKPKLCKHVIITGQRQTSGTEAGILGMDKYYNMTVWILARKEINFSMAAGLIRLHMPGVK